MANNPKKLTDSADETLTAIQQVLSVSDDPVNNRSGSPAEPAPPQHETDRRAAYEPAPATEKDLFEGSAPADADPLRASPFAANDDRQSIGQILKTLQQRPSNTSYVIATVFALAWAGCGVALAFLYMPDLQAVVRQGAPAMPAMIGLAGFVLAPILFFYVLAYMMWRSQEMRLIAQSMASVAMRLSEPEEIARDSVVTVGQAIRREVAAMGDGVERALARAAELEALVANEVSALERAYNDNEVRIRGLLETLAHQRDTLVGQAEQVRNAITGVHLDLSHDISSVSDHVADKVNESAQKIAQALTEKGEHITLALGRAGDSMIGALGERGGDLLERLELASQETAYAIAGASDRLTASLNFKTDHITEEFTEMTTNLAQMMDGRLDDVTQGFAQKSLAIVQMMDVRSAQITEGLVDTSSHLAETIATTGDEVNSTLKSTGESLILDLSLRGGDVVSKLEQTGSRITETIVTRGDKVTETFRENAEHLASTVATQGDAVREMLEARLQSFEEMFSHGGSELAEKITRDSSTLGNLITRHLAEFDRTVKTYGGELVERLGQRTSEVSTAMHDYIDGFDSKVGTKATEVTATLDQRLARFQEALDSRTQTLNDALSSRVMDIAKTLAEGGKEVVGALDQRIEDVTGVINTRGAKLAETLGERIDEIDKSLGTLQTNSVSAAQVLNDASGAAERALVQVTNAAERSLTTLTTGITATLKQGGAELERSLIAASTGASGTIKQSVGEVERTLTAVSTGVSNVLKQNASDVERTLLGVSAEVARNFVGRADEIHTQLTARGAEMAKVLDSNSSTLLAALGAKSKEFSAEVMKATDHAVKSIESQGFTFTRTIMDNSEQISRLVNEASQNATTTVNRTLKELQDSTKAAIEQSRQTTSASVSEMLETHNMLRADSTTLFERLREANILLQEVLTGAHENMSSIENTLVTRVSEFVATMNEVSERSGVASSQVDQHISSFHTITNKALADLGQLAGQFDAHGRSLAEAVALIDRSNRNTEVTLGERRATIESLVASLDARTDDIEQRLKRFSTLLDESLDGATGRAREIARIVSESSAEGARTLEEERTRASELLHGIYTQHSGETHEMFSQTTQRFSETLQGMRQMAAEMQRELETTRNELRKGILELPQETADSASQMRRVIVDQIEALAELNRIVARHGRGLDATEPQRRAPEPAYAAAGGRPEPQRMEGPPRMDLPPRPPAPPRADITGAAPMPPPRRAESPSLSPGQGQGNGRNGWLSDLLHRASKPDDAAPGGDRPARHSLESLDSLSVDIARMIDHDAAAELWDRYNRGERNVFTKRLYTMQGQKTFDELRRKYRSDREFKQTVDRYTGEFERMLEEVSRGDRGQVVARTYLTSETGKVYTMLAHAAGRFGE